MCKTCVIMCAVVGLSLAAARVSARKASWVITHRRVVMHTEVLLSLASPLPPGDALAAAIDDAFGVFERIDRDLNEWRPESELSRLNREAGGAPVVVSADLCHVLRIAHDGARRTAGLFDPTWAALRDLWRFDGPPQRVPSAAEVRAQCGAVDWTALQLGLNADGACTVRLARAGMRLGLGGLVKGWGIDQAAARLRAGGVRNFLLQAGGDLYAAGLREGEPWKIGVRDPRGPEGATLAWLAVSDAAFSTSGDYERFFEVDGRRYHHLIDPRTCWPATGARSATLLAASATEAEILSKAAFIAGPQAGLALVEAQGATALIIDAQGGWHVSKALAQRLQPTAAPGTVPPGPPQEPSE